LSIVPLLGWYDWSFGVPGVELQRLWIDFQAWPTSWSVADVSLHFMRMNTYERQNDDEIIVSFSHFLPRIDVVSKVVSGRYRYLFPVLGTTRLEQQLRELRSKVHVYGHSHLNRRLEIGGTLYVNNAYGYPHETQITRKKLLCVYEYP
jgi:Icc-related predicted phosphoesterase